MFDIKCLFSLSQGKVSHIHVLSWGNIEVSLEPENNSSFPASELQTCRDSGMSSDIWCQTGHLFSVYRELNLPGGLYSVVSWTGR